MCPMHNINNVDYMYSTQHKKCGLHVQCTILAMWIAYTICNINKIYTIHDNSLDCIQYISLTMWITCTVHNNNHVDYMSNAQY